MSFSQDKCMLVLVLGLCGVIRFGWPRTRLVLKCNVLFRPVFEMATQVYPERR
jgi:hypothetical protein